MRSLYLVDARSLLHSAQRTLPSEALNLSSGES